VLGGVKGEGAYGPQKSRDSAEGSWPSDHRANRGVIVSPKRIYGDSFTVLVNPDREYSLIAAGSPVPSGWKPAGREGTKDQCIDFIEEVWTDMRPLDRERLLRL